LYWINPEYVFVRSFINCHINYYYDENLTGVTGFMALP